MIIIVKDRPELSKILTEVNELGFEINYISGKFSGGGEYEAERATELLSKVSEADLKALLSGELSYECKQPPFLGLLDYEIERREEE